MSTQGKITGVKITGLATAVPDNLVRNSDYFDKWGKEYVQKVIDVTGIEERYAALPNQTASDFAFEALNLLRERGRWTNNSVDALIFLTQSPDYPSPASSFILHHRLGIHKECMTFDVTAGCPGFVYGVFLASTFLQMPDMNRILICGGDCSTLHGNPEDNTTALLFGDGCFAAVLEKNTGGPDLHYHLQTFTDSFKAIMTPVYLPFGRNRSKWTKNMDFFVGRLRMQGMDVFSFTISEVPAAIKSVLNEVPPESIDYLFLHQANLYILKQVARAVKFKMDKVPISLNKFGNTSGASIPFGICDLFGNSLDATEKHLLLAGFGVGLSVGVMDVFLSPSVCEPVIKTKNFFDDGVQV